MAQLYRADCATALPGNYRDQQAAGVSQNHQSLGTNFLAQHRFDCIVPVNGFSAMLVCQDLERARCTCAELRKWRS